MYIEGVGEVEVIRKRISRMYIHVGRGRHVFVTAPRTCSEDLIRRFLTEKKDWILATLEKTPEAVEYEYTDGEEHILLGKKVTLHVAGGASNACTLNGRDVMITVRSSRTSVRKIYEEWSRDMLRRIVVMYIKKWAETMGVFPGDITIRKMKGRWGSCNVKTGELCFSLDLITKDGACIEGVVVHELNHLLEKGHTRRFHDLMAHWVPDYKERQKILSRSPREFI